MKKIFSLIIFTASVLLLDCSVLATEYDDDYNDDPFQFDFLQTVVREKRSGDGKPAEQLIENQKTDSRIFLNTEVPWENFIVPVPTMVALLGQLMVLSSVADFKLIQNTGSSSLTLRNPQSFRATLTQLANDVWKPFRTAETNMDKIREYMSLMPNDLKAVYNALRAPTLRLIKATLPKYLKAIQQKGEECAKLASDTEKAFVDIELLLGQILDLTNASSSQYDDKHRQVVAEIEASKTKKSLLDQYRENLKQKQMEIDEQAKLYHDAYIRALNKIPVGWEKVTSEGLIGWLVNTVNNHNKWNELETQNDTCDSKMGDNNSLKTSSLIATIQQLSSNIDKIKKIATDIFTGGSKTKDPAKRFAAYAAVLDMYAEAAQKLDFGQAAIKTEQFANEVSNICKRISASYTNSNTLTREDQDKILNQLDTVARQLKPIVAMAAINSYGMTAQNIFNYNPKRNHTYEALVYSELLKSAQQISNKTFKELFNAEENIFDVMSKMSELDFERISLQEIIKVAKDGILYLAKIKEQWEKLVQFFSMVSIRAEVASNNIFTPFLHMNINNETENLLNKTFKQQAFEIQRISTFLFELANVYVTVSGKYNILNRIAGLSQYQVIDNNEERKTAMKTFLAERNKAVTSIKEEAKQKHQELNSLMQQRIQETDPQVNRLNELSQADKEAFMKGFDEYMAKKFDPEVSNVINKYDVQYLLTSAHDEL